MDPEVEALYGLPLDEFTNARDALARARSKEQGKDAGAAYTKGASERIRNDKSVESASEEVAQRHGSDVTMGSYQKDLVARTALKEISELSSQIRTALYKRTLPWLDDGFRTFQ